MKVLNLRCANGHAFEGWFASDDDFMAQNGRSLIECPMCADHVVTRMPSAPRLNLSAAKVSAPEQMPTDASDMQLSWLKAVRHALETTEDVGPRFAQEARRIHYGEVDARGIRGQATADERDALREEGIEVVSMAVPAALKGPIQ